MTRRIAIIGAGMAGLRVASRLARAGEDVVVFDKARGASGRISTRRLDWGSFDHGASCFMARTPGFEAQVADWVERGIAAPWRARVAVFDRGTWRAESSEEIRYVGVPGMSALARDLVQGLALETGLRIASLRRTGAQWTVVADDGFEIPGFDAVVVAVPAPQAVPLLAGSPLLARHAQGVSYRSCHSLMVDFEEPLDLDFDRASLVDSRVGWVSREASKPGRAGSHGWVIQSSPIWSEGHLDWTAERVAESLLEDFGSALGRVLPSPRHATVHRWLYARVVAASPAPEVWDVEAGIGICGDWTLGDGLECAFASADRLVDRISDRGRAQSAA